VVKPVDEGSSLGVAIVRDPASLKKAVAAVGRKYGDVLVERFITGMNVTVGILGAGARTRALPILELVPKNEFYDYQAKYTGGMTEFIITGRPTGPWAATAGRGWTSSSTGRARRRCWRSTPAPA